MTEIKTFTFNPFQVNTYIVYDNTKECIIIDPGCYDDQERNILKSFISTNDLKPVRLFNTHCHVDHIMGNKFIKQEYGLDPEFHKEDHIFLATAVQQANMFEVDIEPPPTTGIFIDENDTVTFGETEMEIIHIPGHSPGSLVFYNKKDKFVIVGDVLFAGSIGRTDLPSGNYELLIQGIKEKLLNLDKDTVAYTGHGPETTIGYEAATNFYLT